MSYSLRVLGMVDIKVKEQSFENMARSVRWLLGGLVESHRTITLYSVDVSVSASVFLSLPIPPPLPFNNPPTPPMQRPQDLRATALHDHPRSDRPALGGGRAPTGQGYVDDAWGAVSFGRPVVSLSVSVSLAPPASTPPPTLPLQPTVYSAQSIAVGMARLGADTQYIVSGTMEELANLDRDGIPDVDFGGPLHCLCLPGTMHFLEADMLRWYAVDQDSFQRYARIHEH